MKNLITIFIFGLFCPFINYAQLSLDVQGNAQINGKISIDVSTNSVYIGKFAGDNGNGSDVRNVFVGQAAGTQNTSGNDNVFLGRASGTSNTSGNANTFVGKEAGRSNTSGGDNLFMGFDAGYTNTTGSDNVYLGHTSGRANNGNRNVMIGYEAGLGITSATDEVIIGYRAAANATRPTTSFGVVIGKQAGEDSERGDVLIGFKAGEVNQGANNVFVGETTGQKNTTGANNVIIGSDAGRNNTTGRVNVFIGQNSGAFNSTGVENTFIGANSGEDNSTARGGTFVGYKAGASNTTAEENTFIGTNAGLKTNVGRWNTFIGSSSGENNSTGRFNVFIGKNAGNASAGADNNVCIGTDAGLVMNGGDRNTFVGKDAGASVTTGSVNTLLGEDSGHAVTTGSGNVIIGENAGITLETGNNNTIIGEDADVTGASATNMTAIGNGAVNGTNNSIKLGNNDIVLICGKVSFSTCSDARFKTGVKENVPGLSFIQKLRPVTYQYDVNKMDNHQRRGIASLDDDDVESEKSKGNSDLTYTGFLAQEVEAAAKASNFDFSAVHSPQNENDMYSLAYAEFVVPLVKATQEQQAIIEELKEENKALESRLTQLEKLLSNQVDIDIPTNHITLHSAAKLEQNQPNPSRGTTTIRYFIPTQTKQAQLQIAKIDGQIIKKTNINTREWGQTIINAEQLKNGNYVYSLYLDGQLIDTKKMVLMK